MKYFAIQQISTGRLLPLPRGRSGRGGTHVEFEDEGMPRLFPREQSAKAALRHWLEGATSQKIRISNGFDDPDEAWLETEPKPHRRPEDVCVVPVSLEVMK